MSMLAIVRASLGATLALGVAAAHADPITIDDALTRAARRPTVAIAGAEVDAARGEADGARRSLYNPELGLAVGPRVGGGDTLLAAEASLAQTFELGGKRGARRDAAEARVRAATAGVERAAYLARLEAWRAYQHALVQRARLETTHEAEALAVQVATASRDRQELGAGTQLQVNLTTSEVGRAGHDRVDAENAYEAALAALASAVGAGAQERVEPTGSLAALPEASATEAALVERARAGHPELQVARAELHAAEAEVRLADALAAPDVTLSVSYGLEQDPEATFHTVLIGASIPLPVRNRNQGGQASARAWRTRATLHRDLVDTETERELRTARRAYVRARAAVQGFDAEVNERLHDNLDLARQSFEAGKIDYFEFSVVRRDLVENRLAYLDAMVEAIDAWSALQRAAGNEGSQ